MLRPRLRLGLLIGLLPVLAAVTPAFAQTLTINFDRGPDGSVIGSGDEISDLYVDQGITFSTLDNGGDDGNCDDDGGVYASNDRGSWAPEFGSSPNVVTLCGPSSFASDFTEIIGEIVVDFTRDVDEVCIGVIPGDSSDRGWLEAYAAGAENPMQTATSSAGVAETICVSSAAGGNAIRSVHFSAPEVSPVSRYARFDDLRITFEPLVIDFDFDPAGQAIADGTDLADVYSSRGVLFEKAEGTGTCGDVETVYANDDRPGGFGSSPNVVSACNTAGSDFSEDTNGLVSAVLLAAATKLCVEALPVGGDRAVLRAFDEQGILVGSDLTGVGVMEELCVEGEGIRFAEFAGRDADFARFDNLKITFGGAELDFDRDPLGQEIVSGTAVNSTYQSLGITLLRDSGTVCGAEGMVYANDDFPGGFGSSPNVVSPCASGPSDFSENGFGLIHALFSVDATSVCVDVRPTEADDRGVLRAFDVDDMLIDSETSTPGASELLCISAPEIRAVRFGGWGDDFARFDDLSVAIPEPSAAALGLAALAGLAGLRRRRGPGLRGSGS